MAVAPDQLLAVLAEAQRPVGIKELLRLSGMNPGHQTEVKRVLRELLKAGQIDKDGKRFVLPEDQRKAHAPAVEASQAPARRPAAAPAARGARPGRVAVPPKKRGEPAEAPVRGAGRAAVAAPPERAPGGYAARALERSSRGGAPARGAERGRGAGRDEGRGRGSRTQGGVEPPREKAIAQVEGILHVHRDGFGFVHPLSGEGENIFLPPQEVQKALDKDRVLVDVVRDRGRTSGRMVDVVQRRRTQVVGTYFERGRRSYVVPNDANMTAPIRVPPTQLARDGDLVKVTLGVGEGMVEAGEGLFGEVAGSVGRPGDPSAEVLGIVFSQGFSDEFPPEVMAEADRIPLQVGEEEATEEDRHDLRKMALVTIDGEDARDFDDAVYAEEVSNGWRLVVAIADVTHYVREGTDLDREALRRATSVYMPGRVMPMLPERLSAGICSLRPDEDRLCMVADLEIDRSGTVRREDFYPAVMRSVARCTYNEVQSVLDGEDVPHRNAFRPHLQRLMTVARTLNGVRVSRGAIDFDIPETRVVLGENDLPLRVEKRERKDAHRLVEECMLAANEAVARHFKRIGEPSVYRYHAEPDEEKLQAFSALAATFGFHLPEGDLTSKALADFLEQLEEHPEKRALNQLLLRSMMQAVYSAENIGHYGLAAEHYLHFTSPIRRYPDLLVHRQLKKRWSRGNRSLDESLAEVETERLEAMAAQSSDRERAAMQVEREVSAFYSALLMKDRVGEEFDATVGSVTDFGFFVELDVEMVEGLVKAETLGPGFKLDPVQHALVYPSGRRVKVGQKLRVRLESVNLSRRQLDFVALNFAGEQPLPSAVIAPFNSKRFLPKSRAPGGDAPGRRQERPRQAEVEPRRRAPAAPSAKVEEPVISPTSPHPGFDRLRALAAKKGLLTQPTPGRSSGRGAARGEGGGGSSRGSSRLGAPKKERSSSSEGGRGGPKKGGGGKPTGSAKGGKSKDGAGRSGDRLPRGGSPKGRRG
ncbi:MAG: ribonuclease R [Myxococcota bacterium]|nr:ribonuclease R [Myxococcota bacterium]